MGFMLLASGAFGQYESEKDASIPLKYFYIKKQKNPVRLFLSKFTVSFSTGYAATNFKHSFDPADSLGIIQETYSRPKLYVLNDPSVSYENWVNRITQSPYGPAPGATYFRGDTIELGFRARGYNIPFKASVHFEFDRYRIGVGYSIDYMHTGTYRPTQFGSSDGTTPVISSFKPIQPSTFLKKYFIMGGASVYRYNEYLLTATAEIGGMKLGRQYDKSQITTGLFINIGPSVEREFSEYFKVFIRPSYELRSYKLNFQESGTSITHKFNSFYINVGASYRLPELPKCFLKDCKVQIDHAHGNKLFRSRVHPFYQKQNPHYGEDYPRLIKYKGRNKRKLNPY